MTTGFGGGREALRHVDVAIGAAGRPADYKPETARDRHQRHRRLPRPGRREGEHHATAVTPTGKKAFDQRLPNSEPELREPFAKLQAKHGTMLVVADQLARHGRRRCPRVEAGA
jgi:hypothetical protein